MEQACGGPVVHFADGPAGAEIGIDQGGLTRELFTLFRQRLVAPSRGDLALFEGFSSRVGAHDGGWNAQETTEERGFVPRAGAAYETAAMLEKYRLLGRAIFVVVRSGETLSNRFASFVLAYLCAEDALPLADRAAIGTAGSFEAVGAAAGFDAASFCDSDRRALEEVERVLTVTSALDPELAESLRRMVTQPLDPEFSTGADMVDDSDGDVTIENTEGGRARFVCSYLHGRLIGCRRRQLEAMKDGFCRRSDEADLRAALGLYTAQELADLYLRQVWIDPLELVNALRFEGQWGADEHTPRYMRELILHWAGQPQGNSKLQQWLAWVTGSDQLHKAGTIIRVHPTQSSEHLPEATTCSCEMRLPASVESMERLAQV